MDGELPAIDGPHAVVAKALIDVPMCGCSEIPATLWEKEVLLMRQTFEAPPVKDGHA